MKKAAGIFILLLAVIVASSSQTASPEYVPGEVLVVYNPGSVSGMTASDTTPGISVAALGFGALSAPGASGIQRLSVPAGVSVEQAVAVLSAQADVSIAQPNYIYHALLVPNDASLSSQWHIPKIDAYRAWDFSIGDTSVVVAILDTGVDTDAKDLPDSTAGGGSGMILLPGSDYISSDSDPNDEGAGIYEGHGTGIAAIIGAMTNNGETVAGICWYRAIMPLRVLNSSGIGTTSTIAEALVKAGQNGADVVNLSLGASSQDAAMASAISDLHDSGIIVVAAAGNDGTSNILFPADLTTTIAVGASTTGDARASFSSYGDELDLVAPGDDIFTLSINDGTATHDGTSFSSPVVAGAAALVKAIRPKTTADTFRAWVQGTSDDISTSGWDETTGAGRIDLGRLAALVSSNPSYDTDASTVFTDTFTYAAIADSVQGASIVAGGRNNGSALSLDAAGEYAGYLGTRANPGSGSIEFYIRLSNTQFPAGDSRFILTQRGNGAKTSGDMDLLLLHDNRLRLTFEDSGSITSSTALNPAQWYHIGITYGNSGFTLWVNGDSEAHDATPGGPVPSDSIFVGSPSIAGGESTVLGLIDQLRFSNTERATFPTALRVAFEYPTAASSASSISVAWRALESETNPITVTIGLDTDTSGLDGTVLASNTANDMHHTVSLSGLSDNDTRYIYVLVSDGSDTAYAYSDFLITYSSSGGSSLSSQSSGSGSCLLTRISPLLDLRRPLLALRRPLLALRDCLSESVSGRILTLIYYAL